MPSILVVDDDRAIQELLVTLFQEQGYDVDVCRSGAQVIDQLQSKNYDVLVLDILIPHINGFKLIEHIRAHPDLEDQIIIMISGIYRSRNHRQEMITKFQVLDYLDKPLRTEKLIRLVTQSVSPKKRGQSIERSHSGVKVMLLSDDQNGADREVKLERVHTQDLEPMHLEASKSVSRKLSRKTPPPPPIDEKLVDNSAKAERKLVENEAKQSFRTSAFVMQGAIQKSPVAAILGQLWHQRVSGGLLLRRRKIKKIIYLRTGQPFLVKSNLINECLGPILLRERLISKDECIASVEHMKKTGQRQGEILIQMGCLTQNNVRFALELQLETKIFETFHWDEGEYRFNPSLPLPESDIELEWNGHALVVEGIRRTFDESRLRKLMIPVLDVPLKFMGSASELTSMRFSDQEIKAIKELHLPQTTKVLLETMDLEPSDTIRVIYTLITLEILKPAI